MRSYFVTSIFIYLIMSLFALEIRMLSDDCKHRYINYLLPLSLLHCDAGK